jgi:acetyl esterase/lipase
MVAQEPLEPELALAGAARSYRILYSSTDGVGGTGRVPVSGTVFLPRGTRPADGWPLVAWAHGSVGMPDICAPSLQGRSLRDIAYLNRWLGEGYAIVATDYQGQGTPGPHPYLSARSLAYSVLDSIRAAQASFPDLGRKVVVVGQSQGGHAAVAASVYAKAYAPELDLRGTVATGTPYVRAKDGGRAFLAHSKPSIVSLMYLLVYAQQLDRNLDPALVVNEQALPLFRQAASVCISRFEFDTLGSGLEPKTAFKAGPLVEAMERIVPSMAYPDLESDTPIFLGIGGKDEAVPAAVQRDLAKDACAAGTVVEAHLYPELTHSGALNGSLQDSVPFVGKVMRGERVKARCEAAGG